MAGDGEAGTANFRVGCENGTGPRPSRSRRRQYIGSAATALNFMSATPGGDAARREAALVPNAALPAVHAAAQRVARDLTAKLVADRRPTGPDLQTEAQLGTAQARRLRPRRPPADRGGAHGNDLEPLLELEFERPGRIEERNLGLPPARDARRDDPKVDVAQAQIADLLLRDRERLPLIGLPAAHVIVVGDDPRSGGSSRSFGRSLRFMSGKS